MTGPAVFCGTKMELIIFSYHADRYKNCLEMRHMHEKSLLSMKYISLEIEWE